MGLVLAGLVLASTLTGSFRGAVVDWPEAFKQVAFCLFAFPCGGFIVGGLLHFAATWKGATIVGLLGACIPSFAASVSLFGLPAALSLDNLELTAISVLVFGIMTALVIHNFAKKTDAGPGIGGLPLLGTGVFLRLAQSSFECIRMLGGGVGYDLYPRLLEDWGSLVE